MQARYCAIMRYAVAVIGLTILPLQSAIADDPPSPQEWTLLQPTAEVPYAKWKWILLTNVPAREMTRATSRQESAACAKDGQNNLVMHTHTEKDYGNFGNKCTVAQGNAYWSDLYYGGWGCQPSGNCTMKTNCVSQAFAAPRSNAVCNWSVEPKEDGAEDANIKPLIDAEEMDKKCEGAPACKTFTVAVDDILVSFGKDAHAWYVTAVDGANRTFEWKNYSSQTFTMTRSDNSVPCSPHPENRLVDPERIYHKK